MRTVSVSERSQVAEARRYARDAALDLGLGDTAAERAALIATEAATNLERHAQAGELLLLSRPDPHAARLDIVSVDHGPGIDDLSECLRDGFSSKGGAGQGLGAIRRQSDRFDIHSTPGKGTVVVASVGYVAAPVFDFQIEGICSPKPGETLCGDGWASVGGPEFTTVMVCDGLGHGPKAATAARAARCAFSADASAELPRIISNLDAGMQGTRGAAVALARIPARAGPLDFLGVGNISGYLRSGSEDQRTVSFEGVVGSGEFRSRTMTYEIEDPFLAIFATDGLSMRWDLARYRGLIAREPITIAAVLYRDFRRTRDDCTVVVARRSVR